MTEFIPEARCFECGRDIDPSQADYLFVRVCEICGSDEPEDHDGGNCPLCGVPVWWVPKCPTCGASADFIYEEGA